MAPPPMPTQMTTIESLKDDNIEEILLRLPSPASLGLAAVASIRWRRIASGPGFLRRFRARHGSSPYSFLGVFATANGDGLPIFHLAGPARSDPGLVAVARSSDFLLACLEDAPDWRLLDCRGGRLLLSCADDTSLSVYDPVSLRRTTIAVPEERSSHFCLLDDDDDAASFRVVCLQEIVRRISWVRAAVYDSGDSQWRFHPWAPADSIMPPRETTTTDRPKTTMCAAGLVFWTYGRDGDRALLVLDTSTMEFFRMHLPGGLGKRPASYCYHVHEDRYSVGDTEGGECCIVCVTADLRLQVWLLQLKEEDGVNGGGKKYTWKFDEEAPMREVLRSPHYPLDLHHVHVGKVVAGLVLVAAGHRAYGLHHFAIDLMSLSFKAKFSADIGLQVYPFQLPWIPAAAARLPTPQMLKKRQDASSAGRNCERSFRYQLAIK